MIHHRITWSASMPPRTRWKIRGTIMAKDDVLKPETIATGSHPAVVAIRFCLLSKTN
jgi:hypothetical protein